MPLREVLTRQGRGAWRGSALTQRLIRSGFAGSASVTIIVLGLIMLFLLREGAGFLGTYRRELELYRRCGLEFCDLLDRPLAQQEELAGILRRALSSSLEPLMGQARARRDEALRLKREIDQATQSQREAMEQAKDEAARAQAALRLKQATETAAAALVIAPLFQPQEAAGLRSELGSSGLQGQGPTTMIGRLQQEFIRADKAAKAQFQGLQEAIETLEDAPEDLRDALAEVKELALAAKEQASLHHTLEEGRQKLLNAARSSRDEREKAELTKEAEASHSEPPDYTELHRQIAESREGLVRHIASYSAKVDQLALHLPESELKLPEASALLQKAAEALPQHAAATRASVPLLRQWKADQPVGSASVLAAFFFGSQWLTNSSWQDFFGFLPLLSGSLIIALIAIAMATPLSVAAAIYCNQFASPREREWIKPIIEFIQAIPSVVLGFIGISVLGDLLKDASQLPALSWIPGFPISERLNMFNAGCLLALMAIPTMFSLAEDALNNVPQAYIDASEALGATQLQTIFRVIVPAALSGMGAAVLLGLGRVIGETMVVLLVAGNRIAIPDFSDSVGVIFQPAHTLTGIIAQELGEVSRGSAHWQALFMVGIVLFAISLAVNAMARALVRRFELPKS
jgi:phosphate transport system permease protein